eukprot:TRINITY_DN44964_c0_g1_i2.p1 TRINITY_DN44964_c0_g1~~TRINITY_DN44964_c0_g1_i2.p1  ORF type:complete len:144 (+),score=38.97 TRINITY_DN44964_c0_g1_i2:101-532(+)
MALFPSAVASGPAAAVAKKFTQMVAGDYKMVMCVRMDLKMDRGKIVAQCGHAVLGAFKNAQSGRHASMLRNWEARGQAKIALKCPDEKTFWKMEQDARKKGLNVFVVTDAGKTQVAAGSKTVLAIGPGSGSVIDSVTGDMKLL